METIFDKIISGKIASHKIYEDELVLAILDIQPINEGHVLVIPKTDSTNFTDLDNTNYLHLMKTVQSVAKRLQRIYQPPKIGVIIEGFEVAKTHVHVFPAYSAKDFHKTNQQRPILSEDKLESCRQKIASKELKIS